MSLFYIVMVWLKTNQHCLTKQIWEHNSIAVSCMICVLYFFALWRTVICTWKCHFKFTCRAFSVLYVLFSSILYFNRHIFRHVDITIYLSSVVWILYAKCVKSGYKPILWLFCRFLDNRLFATCSDDTTIALWDLRKLNSKVCSLHGHASWVKNIEYDTHTRLLVTSGFDGNVITWDTNRFVLQDSHTILRAACV